MKQFRMFFVDVIILFLLFSSISKVNVFAVEKDESNAHGTLQVQKVSSQNVSVVSEENVIAGSVFGIYQVPDATQGMIAHVTIGIDGYSNIVSLAPGTYYVREDLVARGFIPHVEFQEVVIKPHEKSELVFNGIPSIKKPSIQLFGVAGVTYWGGTMKDAPYWCDNDVNGHYLYMAGKQVQCLMPGVKFTTSDRMYCDTKRPWFITESTAKKLALVNYYGRKYNNRGSNPKFNLASQSLVWKILYAEATDGNVDYYGSGKNRYLYRNSSGDVSNEMNIIQKEVDSHYLKPSFDTQTFEVTPGETLVLEDTAGHFSRYTTNSHDQVTQTKKDQTWTIQVNENVSVGTTILLTYQHYADSQDGTTLYYHTPGAYESGDWWNGWQITGEFYVPDYPSGYIQLKVKAPKGDLQISKASMNPEMTDDNDCYSLVGATYGVYTSEDCSSDKKVGELKIEETLQSNILTLPADTYWLKELVSPKGYQLDLNVYPVEVKPSTMMKKELVDIPKTNPIEILLKKIEKGTDLPLENAEFTFDFYKGEYAENINPATLGKSPDYSWVLKTDQEGYCRLKEEYLVSGDDLHTSLPLGTLVFYESKAPSGYRKNEEIFVKKIGLDDNGDLEVYQYPLIANSPITLTVIKKQAGIDVLLPHVEFKHTYPDGSFENVKTDDKGQVCLNHLSVGVHTIQETKTLDDLLLDENVLKFEVKTDGTIQALTDMKLIFDEEKNGICTLLNQTAPFKIKVSKMNEFEKALEGATFALCLDREGNQIEETKTTNQQGELLFSALKVGVKYYIKEIKAPDGYFLPLDEEGSCHMYEIYVESKPSQNVFNFYVDGKKYTTDKTEGEIHLEGMPSNRVICLSVVNSTGIQLPHTGSQSSLILLLCGMSILIVGMFQFKKERGSAS